MYGAGQRRAARQCYTAGAAGKVTAWPGPQPVARCPAAARPGGGGVRM